MSRHVAAIATVFLASGVVTAFAREPLWTDEERAQRSIAVFTGQVVSIERVEALNDHEDLCRAVIAVEAVSKAPDIVGKGKFSVYFERPRDGRGGRCPKYVELKERQRANFFVRQREVGSESLAFLDMGSDVREPSAESRIAIAFSSTEKSPQANPAPKKRESAPSRSIEAADSLGPAYPVGEAAERTTLMLKRKLNGNTNDAILMMLGVSIAAITAWLAVRFVNWRKRTRVTVTGSRNQILQRQRSVTNEDPLAMS